MNKITSEFDETGNKKRNIRIAGRLFWVPVLLSILFFQAFPNRVSHASGSDTLRIMYWNSPNILNPHLSSSVKDWEVCRIFYEPMASFDRESKLIPFLAAEIPSRKNGLLSEDGTWVVWKIKPNIKWSDDVPLTSEDIRFTYQYVSNPKVGAASASAYESVKDVEIMDKHTVKVHFKTATPSWSLPFVGVEGMILPKHKFDAYNGANAREAPANFEPVGTGPYMVLPPGIRPQEVLFLGNKLIKTTKIILKPNPYFREKSKLYFSKVEIKGGGIASEAAHQVLQTGEIDYTWNLNLPVDFLAKLESGGAGKAFINFRSTVEQIELNWTNPHKETEDGERSSIRFPHPFFNVPEVRQAFAHAIDRRAIAKNYGSGGQITYHILTAPPRYKSGRTFYEYDLEKASALLRKAGWEDSNNDEILDKDGKKLSVLLQTYAGSIPQKSQKIVQRGLQAIGVDVAMKIVDGSMFYGSDRTHPDHNGRFHADIQITGWSNNNPDPGNFLKYWTCDQIPQKSNNWTGNNFRRWCNPEYDALYNESTKQLYPEKRQRIFLKMNDMLSEEVVTIPIVRQARISGISRDLKGFSPTPWDSETWNIKDWRRISQ